MSERFPDSPPDDLKALAEDMELGGRHEGLGRWLIPVVAAAWSVFQLSLPYFLTLDSTYVRAVHLGFAIFLVYLSYPALKKPRGPAGLGFLWEGRRVPAADVLLALLALAAALYYALDYLGISSRAGLPLRRDIVAGVVLIVLLLEAARRSLGPALPIIAAAFLAYAFFAAWLPDLLAFQSRSLQRIVSQLTLSTEGVYGVPLYVSASTVYLYVLFGAMLDRTGGGAYFVRLAYAMLGRFRGGPAKAAVVASGLTGIVSGSSIANVVTTGTFTIPLMTRSGYGKTKAAAIEVAASVNGQLMPPIMGAAAFIMAEYCNVPYFEVVRAAIIPAALAYAGLLFIVHVEAVKLGLKPMPRAEIPPFWRTLSEGLRYLAPIALLLYLLMVRRYSPELSAFWAILGLAACVALHNVWTAPGARLEAIVRTAREVGESLSAGGRGMMPIGVAVGAAGIIVGIVSMGPGQRITEVVDHLAGGNIYLILFLTAGASLILGMGLPTTANYIVVASLTASVIVTLAGNAGYAVPILAAHLFVFYFGILADDTPPVGLAAYAAAAIAKTDPIRTGIQGFFYDMRTAILPFMFIFNTDLLLMGVDAWWEAALIFLTGLAGIFAFTALLQNYWLARNGHVDRILLILAMLLLLQPLFFERIFQLSAIDALAAFSLDSRWPWRGVGVLCCAAVLGMQQKRRARNRDGTGLQPLA